MSNLERIKQQLGDSFIPKRGFTVVVDGQFGSTGKGVISGAMAEMFYDQIDLVTTNAAPNSGHTFYTESGNDKSKIVLKQLPTFSVMTKHKFNKDIHTYLNNGAVIDLNVLENECITHKIRPIIGKSAAVITMEQKLQDELNVSNIASTGQGVGPGIINKLMRDEKYVFKNHGYNLNYIYYLVNNSHKLLIDCKRVFVEVSQGYSLGINSGFYPYTTTRECTVAQALADLGAPPQDVANVIASYRTYPIRVGNTDNSSGGFYPDQQETTWGEIGREPELTTVTKRVRRVFSWSKLQFKESVYANKPNVLFVNFMNYLPKNINHGDWLRENVLTPYLEIMNKPPLAILAGYGQYSSDIKLIRKGIDI
jgi:adenylosuccinate synthase